MIITLKSFANIRDVIGTERADIELPRGATLTRLFELLSRRYGQDFDNQIRDKATKQLVPFLILVNDKTYRSTADMGTVLADGDVVTIMIPFDGG